MLEKNESGMEKELQTSVVRRLHKCGILKTDLFKIISSRDTELLEVMLCTGLTTNINEYRLNNVADSFGECIAENWLSDMVPLYPDVAEHIHRITPLALAMLLRDDKATLLLKRFNAQYSIETSRSSQYELYDRSTRSVVIVDITPDDLQKILSLNTEEERMAFFKELWPTPPAQRSRIHSSDWDL